MKKLIAGEITTGDVALTVEPNVQSMLEKNLEKTKEKIQSPNCRRNDYQPKDRRDYRYVRQAGLQSEPVCQDKRFFHFMNPLVESVIEMGSIMKPLTLAASMDNGSITASTTYTDNGFLAFGPSRIENYDGKARGKADMQRVLNGSLNTGAVFAMQKMGKDKFKDYMLGYGFGGKNRHRIASGSEK